MTSTLCEPCVTDEQCLVEGAACLALNDGNFCSVPCDAAEDCPSGYTCQTVAGVAASQCVPVTSACTCDGSNLDLQLACEVSYEAPGGGVSTTCYGTTYCTEQGWSECELPTEICNYLDDNCDGVADETFKNAAGQYASDEHCGQCNANCSTLTFENGAGTCDTDASLQCILVCDPGFSDVNQNPADGCECPFLSDVDFPDGVMTTGWSGWRCGPGLVCIQGRERSGNWNPRGSLPDHRPCPGCSGNHGKRDVYVATGVYSENLVLRAEVSLYGDIARTSRFMTRSFTRPPFSGVIPHRVRYPERLSQWNHEWKPGDADGWLLVFGANATTAGASSYTIYITNCDDCFSSRTIGYSLGTVQPVHPVLRARWEQREQRCERGRGAISNCQFGSQFTNG